MLKQLKEYLNTPFRMLKDLTNSFKPKGRGQKRAQLRLCKLGPDTVPCPHSNIHVKLFPSRLFSFVRTWAMPRLLYLSCGIPFPGWTPDNISGFTLDVVWLSRWEVIKKISGNFLREGRGQNNLLGGPIFKVVFIFEVVYLMSRSNLLFTASKSDLIHLR